MDKVGSPCDNVESPSDNVKRLRDNVESPRNNVKSLSYKVGLVKSGFCLGCFMWRGHRVAPSAIYV